MSDHFKELRAMAVRLLYLIIYLVVIAVAPAVAQDGRSAPEADTGRYTKQAAKAKNFMVSAANPLAVAAGVQMLRKGGTAVDAAIAVQLVLNLVEPQSSGIGGGAFLLHWDQAAQELKTYDGREKAPAAAQPDRFLRDGKRLPFWKAVKSGLSIGVPGLVKLLEYAHQRHGKLPWTELFEPAIRLSENGFQVSPRLRNLLWLQTSRPFSKAAQDYFFDTSSGPENPEPWPVGHLLKNPEFAKTLIAIRDGGAAAFYEGPIAQALIDASAKAPNFPGDITLNDMASYNVKERPPVCSLYRKHNVCGMGPPSSGALTVAQVLKLVERWPLGTGPGAALNPRAMHLLAEAGKLAFADRNRYMADPDFVSVPPGLLDESYVGSRAKGINPDGAMQRRPQPGRPPGVQSAHFGRDATRESVGTSHISIIDKDGNAVSMTTTIESAFGSGVWAAGFLLNNELTDFSFRPQDRKGRPIANRVEAGKRPRSSMAPTIIFDENGEVRAVLGSPGGSRIILYVIKAVVGIIDWQLDAQAAASLRNFGSRGSGFELEFGEALTLTSPLQILRRAPSIWHGIRMRPFGHRLRPSLMTSGLHIVTRKDGMLIGGADPRREGVARGG
ncbi:MAG: gamma-glutamyltransferase [Pseudomonadota bacterium]